MNQLEKRMVEILVHGREQGIYAGVKAEFEAEGTRTEEMIRLSDITRRAGLKIGMKIGGCEAVRDLIDCKSLGADYIIAPMVESPYALSKYIAMKNKIYTADERKYVRFLFNVETKGALAAIDEILSIAASKDGADGVVFGRVDYTGSCGYKRDDINTDKVTPDVIRVAKGCKERKLDFVVGGGVSYEARGELMKIRDAYLTRFETRKVIFDAKAFDHPQLAEGMALAGEFELLWLKNKHNYYQAIANEDMERITMLEKRRLAAQTLVNKHVAAS